MTGARLASALGILFLFLPGTEAAYSRCLGGAWDTSQTWIRDCTPSPHDGLFGTGQAARTYTGASRIRAGARRHTLSWRLHWFKSNMPGARAAAALPLVVGLHPWSEGRTLDQLLDTEAQLMEYEGAWEDVLFLTVALENGNNLNTWWDGSKVDGVPAAWAMEGIVALVRERIGDACALLADSGAALSGKSVDAGRVYLLGHSMGGSGAYHIGIRHPELFAAIHAHAGFADYRGGPCGNENFCKSFDRDFVGTESERLMMKGLDGKPYPARDYSDMSWFVGPHGGASWTASLGKGARYEPPYVHMTHGEADEAVSVSSADRLATALEKGRFGYSYLRHRGGHGAENFARLHWLLGFRRDRSYPAFTKNSTDDTAGALTRNFLDRLGWQPGSIVDREDRYEIKLVGRGRADVTPRRLRSFAVKPRQAFRWWLNAESGPGTPVSADSAGILTIPSVRVDHAATLIIRPDPAPRENPGRAAPGLPGPAGPPGP